MNISSAPAKALSYITPFELPFILRSRTEPGPKFPTPMLMTSMHPTTSSAGPGFPDPQSWGKPRTCHSVQSAPRLDDVREPTADSGASKAGHLLPRVPSYARAGPISLSAGGCWCCSRVGEGIVRIFCADWVLHAVGRTEDLWSDGMPFMHPESLKTSIQWALGVVHE